VKWVHNRNDRLVSAGNYHVRVWQVNYPGTKLHPMEAKLYKVRRQIISISVTDDDAFAYCGTLTGDVMQVSILRDEIKTFKEPDILTPEMKSISEHRYSKGVKSIHCVRNTSTGGVNVLVGAGDGTIGMVNGSTLKKVAGFVTKLLGGITSIAPIYDRKGSTWKYVVGTDQCNRYDVSPDLIDTVLKASCHNGAVHDVNFPEGCADLVVTASVGDLRIWNAQSKMEILRIQVPNLECYCSAVTPSGRSIVSGWSDGKIRSFYPQSGKIQFVIPDAHTEQVTALAVGDRDYGQEWRLISGGAEGRVRIWKITPQHQAMIASLKEHRAPIKSIKVNNDSSQAISASADGSCIVWDLNKYVRLYALFESNVFLSVLYHPDESQILTCGSNHKISYWDASDGEAIRVIDGGEKEINCLDITQNGEFFVSGSRDMMLKIWHYDNGITCCVGKGHSGNVNAVKISPDERSIVSVCSTGEIIFWEMPNLRQLSSELED
jgi:WD40 repeat protein